MALAVPLSYPSGAFPPSAAAVSRAAQPSFAEDEVNLGHVGFFSCHAGGGIVNYIPSYNSEDGELDYLQVSVALLGRRSRDG
ncbi:hypothetical protein KM043_009383 [Ampulex compressa]|nr:hypothetical protein KM043_009383 [Ampulex compressa]